MRASRRRTAVESAIVLALALLGALVGACLPGPATSPEPSRPIVPDGTVAPMATLAGVDPISGLPVVALTALPPEAAEAVLRIAAGGPYPYPQDGTVFENREHRLPERERGYYHEYTVPTPGSADRGARRIVAGADGEMYWTPDHYDSFLWIAR